MTVSVTIIDEQLAPGFKSMAGGWNTGIVTLSGGLETRNQNWVVPKRRYEFAYQGRTKAQLQALMAFMDDARGSLYPWLLKDYLNFELTNELILTATGGETAAQVKQTWPASTLFSGSSKAFARNQGNIKSGTAVVKKNGVTLTGGGVDYTLNRTTGAITGLSALSGGDLITVTCEFYVKVRFEQDSMAVSADAYNSNDKYIGGGSTTAIEVLS